MEITPNSIQTNYIESFNFLEMRKRRQVNQLVLLNNLQRGDQNIASTLLLTLFTRTLSALYDDKMQVKFLPTQGITQDQLNSFNTLAQSDYIEMGPADMPGKARLDYDWCWDALFFGRGYMETLNFDKKRKVMTPHVINPLVMGYDPYFENPQEWRYYWKWVTKTRWDLERMKKAGKIKENIRIEDIATGVDPYLWEYKQRRDAATRAVEPSIQPADNDIYQILEYFGHDEEGNKCIYWLDKNFSMILMKEKLELDDMVHEDGTIASKWPIVVKEGFRIPHASVPFSIADLLEDKHRAKSVLLNLAFIAAKDSANPVYTYDVNKIKDIAQFFSRQVNQHIPVEGDPTLAVAPLNTKDPMPPGLLNFMSALQQEANDPIGTGVSMEPATGGGETATEVAIDQQLNDMAQSLQSKVLQFGEQEFWSHWFHRYQKHGPALEEKLANIVGVNGITTSTIDLKDFQTDYPPGVLVFSAKEAEYKNLVKRRDMMTLYPNLMQSMDPDGFRNFNKHVFFPLMLEDPSLIDVMFPKSIEEIKAEEQNEILKRTDLKPEEMPPVLETDDHITHLYIHRMLQPKTWASWFHIQEHEDMLAKQQAEEMAMVQSEQTGAGAQNKVGAQRSSPMGAAAPLKHEAKTSMSSSNKNQ